MKEIWCELSFITTYGVCLHNSRKIAIKKTSLSRDAFILSFFQHGAQWCLYIYIFCSALTTAGVPRQSPLLCHFSYPLQLLLGGFLVAAEVSQLALCHWPTHQQRERRLRWSKSRDNQQCDRLARSGSLLLHPPHKAVWSLTWPTSWELQIYVKSVVNRFSWHIVALSDTISAMKTFAVRFLRSAAAGSSSSLFDNRHRWASLTRNLTS